MTREEAIQRFNGIINAMSISIAQSKFYPSKAELDELCDMAIEALQDRPQGEWIYDHHNDEHTCSVCGRKALCDDHVGIDWQMEVLSDYCPSCGARMKGGAE